MTSICFSAPGKNANIWPVIDSLKNQGEKDILKQISVAFCCPAIYLTFGGLMENLFVGKKLKSLNIQARCTKVNDSVARGAGLREKNGQGP